MKNKNQKNINKYKKNNVKKFCCDLPIKEYEEATNICKEKNINKTEVIRKGIEWLKKQ